MAVRPDLQVSRIAGRRQAGRVNGSDRSWGGGLLIACLGDKIYYKHLGLIVDLHQEYFRNGLAWAMEMEGGYISAWIPMLSISTVL